MLPVRDVRRNWLPALVSQSVIIDLFHPRLPSLLRSERAKRRPAEEKAAAWASELQSGMVRNRAELAGREGISRARITQVLGMHPAMT